MAELIPTNCPSVVIKAPPLLPWFTAASVCINDSIGVLLWRLLMPIFLPFALTIPAVTVEFKSKGFPTARTHSPSFTLSESPMKKSKLIYHVSA